MKKCDSVCMAIFVQRAGVGRGEVYLQRIDRHSSMPVLVLTSGMKGRSAGAGKRLLN